MIHMNCGQMYYVYVNQQITSFFIAMVFISGCVVISKYNKEPVSYSLLFVAVLSVYIALLRYFVGGIGIIELARMGFPILVASYAIFWNKDTFVKKYVSIVTFLAVISIVCYTIGLRAPQILRAIFPKSYISAWGIPANGMLFYTYTPLSATRNVGFFSEPGLYQCILNSAIYMILFWKNDIEFRNNTSEIYSLVVLIVAVLTTQSTTGYFSLIAIFGVWFLAKKGQSNRKYIILGVAIILVIYLIYDYNTNGSESFISKVLIGKLVTDTGEFSLNAGTGKYRMGTIEKSLEIFLKSPMGVGYDYITNEIGDTEMVAGVLFKTLAAWGIIPFFSMIVFLLKPFYNARATIAETVAFVLVFVNVTSSQSSMFYTSIVCIPLYLLFKHRWKEFDL